MAEEQTREEINRLYWGSDAPVGDIADRLGVSRRAMYDSIEPQPAGEACPECGGALGFRNRTAVDRREATCPECGLEETLAASRTAQTTSDPQPARATAKIGQEPEVEQLERAKRLSPVPPRPVPGTASGPGLSGALLAGLAAGAAIGYLVRRG